MGRSWITKSIRNKRMDMSWITKNMRNKRMNMYITVMRMMITLKMR